MPHAIELKEIAPLYTAVIRELVLASELSRFIPAACGEVWSFVRGTGLPAPGRNLAVYWDAVGTIEVGVEVSAPFPGNGRVISSQTPSGLAATTTHFGPYGALGEAHDDLVTWCSAQGHRLTDASWELYGHWEKEWNDDPSKIRTDVYRLVQTKRPGPS